jgi:transcriptional regulator with XRE-family HTH domain
MFDDLVRSLDTRRQELGLTKADLAQRSKLPPAAVRRLFSQQHKNPTLTTLVAIADALDVRVCAVTSNDVDSA